MNEEARIAANYRKLRGACTFDARSFLDCVETTPANLVPRECKEAHRGFLQCVLDEWCYNETMDMRQCHQKNRSGRNKGSIKALCAKEERAIDACMAPRFDALRQ